MKNRKNLWVIIGVVCAVVCMALIYRFAGPKSSAGEKHVTVEVRDDTGNVKSYKADTNAETLITVLDELHQTQALEYEGAEGDYGLYITSINGLKADYSVNQAYWAIYVNGDYGAYGVSEQPVTDGDTYTFAFEQ